MVFGKRNKLRYAIKSASRRKNKFSKSVGKNKTELRKVNKAITLFPSAFCLLPPALP
jgi:hypothetical protein